MIYKENKSWEPAILFLAEKHRLIGTPHRGVLGSHIVYQVGNHWIKLMAPLFAKDMDFEIAGLKSLKNRLTIATPAIAAQWNLEGWAYVILEHLSGQSIGNVWKDLSAEKKESLIEQIAETILQIRQSTADPIVQRRFDWNLFITEQFNDCEEKQRKKLFPEEWIKHITEFLNGFGRESFFCYHPQFVHADLT